MKKVRTLITILALSLFSVLATAEESTLEKAETVKNKAVDSVKKTARDVKDKTCEMVNGKLECAAQQMKHSAQDAVDATKTKAKEIENKVDKK